MNNILEVKLFYKKSIYIFVFNIKKHVDYGEIYCRLYDLTKARFCNRFENLRNLYKEFKEKQF